MSNSYIMQRFPSSFPAPVDEGGTGGATKAAAQTALGIYAGLYINPSDALVNSSYVSSQKTYTATKNCFYFSVQAAVQGTSETEILINNSTTNVANGDSNSASNYRYTISMGFLKKGDVLKYNRCKMRVFGLRT